MAMGAPRVTPNAAATGTVSAAAARPSAVVGMEEPTPWATA